MTVEMDNPGTCSIVSNSVKRNNIGASGLEDLERRLSDDIYSLNSWSENLSTSSSSESLTVHSSSSSRHGVQQLDARTKIKTPIMKALSIARTQKKPHSSVKAETKSSKEFESSPVFVNQYQHESSVHYPDLSVFGLHGQYDYDTVDGSHFQINKPNIVNTSEIQTVSNIIDKKMVSGTRKYVLDPPKLPAQRLYPDLEPLKLLYQQENISVVPQFSFPAPVPEGSNSIPKPPHPQTQRRSFFDFNKLPNHNSRQMKTHSRDLSSQEQERTFTFLPTTNSLSDQSSHTSKQLEKYKTNNDHVSHQNSTALAGRLHMSQPSIASEPHLKRQPKSSNDLESLKLSFEHRLEPENVKTKVKSVWYNIKYGWTFKSKHSFKCDSPLFILGKCYHRQKDDPSTDVEEQFLKDFVSRIWFTYRSNFYPIPGTKLSTDCGWGCMLRSGQMLVAQCLVTHFLRRDWRLYDKQTDTESVYYREIIRWFSDPIDTPSDKTPFCLHHLANFGRVYNKDPGEWYGPASVAYIFRDAFIKASETIPVLSQLCIYVAQDCTVYTEDVLNMCTRKDDSESGNSAARYSTGATSSNVDIWSEKWQRSLIILIPIRLGGEVMNEIYIPCVQGLLSQDNCMGIIGGKPKHSLYFIGWQDDKLIYLDPHLCREAVDTSVSDFRIETYHCMTPRKLSINKMDPSCTVGFYIKDGEDFKKFVQEVREFVSPPKQKGVYPLFIFVDGHLNESSSKHNLPATERSVRVMYDQVDQNGQKHRTFSNNSEEFVML